MIISLAIIGLLAGVVGTFSLAWQVRAFSSYTEAQLQSDFRYAVNFIAYYVRQASSISKDYDGSYTLTFPDGTMKFGRNTYSRTLWVKNNSFPLCSHVAQFEIDTSALPLVTIRITSVDRIPGVGRGLPITISKQVRMRNYAR